MSLRLLSGSVVNAETPGLFGGVAKAGDFSASLSFLRSTPNVMMLNIIMFTLHTLTSRYVQQLRLSAISAKLTQEDLDEDLQVEEDTPAAHPLSTKEEWPASIGDIKIQGEEGRSREDMKSKGGESQEDNEEYDWEGDEEQDKAEGNGTEKPTEAEKEKETKEVIEAVQLGSEQKGAKKGPEKVQEFDPFEIFDMAQEGTLPEEPTKTIFPEKKPHREHSSSDGESRGSGKNRERERQDEFVGDSVQCLQKRSEDLPSLDHMPVMLPQPLGAQREMVTLEHLFLTKKNWNTLWTYEGAEPVFAHSYMAGSVKNVQRDYSGMQTCAVVGNGGLMTGYVERWSYEIDSHDVVIRLNQSPLQGFSRHIGTKTTFRMLNAQWTKLYHRQDVRFSDLGALKFYPPTGHGAGYGGYGSEREMEDNWLQQQYTGNTGFDTHSGSKKLKKGMNPLGVLEVPLEKGATIICPITTRQQDDCNVLHKALKKDRPDVKVLYVMPKIFTLARRLVSRYRARMCSSGWGPYDGGQQPSHGLVAIYMAMQMCEKVDVYGFGPDMGEDGRPSAYHYYTGLGVSSSPGHSISAETEEKLLEALAREGKIRWHRGNGVWHLKDKGKVAEYV